MGHHKKTGETHDERWPQTPEWGFSVVKECLVACSTLCEGGSHRWEGFRTERPAVALSDEEFGRDYLGQWPPTLDSIFQITNKKEKLGWTVSDLDHS